MDKSEMINNIRTLLTGVVDAGKEISITLKSPDYADIYLDNQYFNTYSIAEERLLSNIPVEIHKNETPFQMTVLIVCEELQEKYAEYTGAEIQLPAAESEINDALQRARVFQTERTVNVCKCILYEKDIMENIQGVPTLAELNYLAKHLSEFDSNEHVMYRGCIEQRGLENLNIKDLINISYNLQDCKIVYNIKDDYELGLYYADNGLLEWLEGAAQEIWQFLDYRKLGEGMRKKENGVYIDEGYFTNTALEFSEVYDGTKFPEEFTKDEYMLKLQIAGETPEMTAWMSLPASKENISEAVERLGADSIDECQLLAVQSMESRIPQCIHSLERFEEINRLAYKMKHFEEKGELAKFKAMLSVSKCKGISDIICLTEEMKNYELCIEASKPFEYAKINFVSKYKSVLPEEFIRFFDFYAYSAELCRKGNVVSTEYGVLIHNEDDGQLSLEID